MLASGSVLASLVPVVGALAASVLASGTLALPRAANAGQARAGGPVVLLAEGTDRARVPELGVAEAELRIEIAAPGAGSAPANVLLLRTQERGLSQDPRLAARIRAARSIELGEAALADWYRALYPERRESELVRALRDAHRSGATISGTGAAAALLSAAAVVESALEIGESERNPRRLADPRAVWGLALQPWAVIDTHLRGGGSVGRLVEVLSEERLRLGVFLGPEAALVFDARAPALVARGSGAVLVLDLRRARRQRFALRGARLSMLTAGDRWSRRERAVLPAAGALAVAVEARSEERTLRDVLDFAQLAAALELFSRDPAPRELVLRDERRELRIALDREAGAWRREAPARATLARASWDLRELSR